MTGNHRTLRMILPAIFALAPLFGGCDIREISFNSGRRQDGMVMVFTGIDGRQPHNEELCRGIVGAGVAAEVVLADWTAPLGMLFNQTAVDRNRQQAAAAAGRIEDYMRQHPGSPVYLVGHSGGTAIAVWAAELLPADRPVDGIVLMASSLSPGYDLARALARSRQGVVSVYSRRDQALLQTGTTLFGTMDGVNAPAAGFAGFDGDYARAGGRLIQVQWHERMAAAGYDGGHFSVCSRDFVRRHIASLFRLPRWNDAAVATVASSDEQLVATR